MLEEGKRVTKIDEVPAEEHWMFLEFGTVTVADGYSNDTQSLALDYYAFTDEKLLNAYILRHISQPYPKPFVVLRVMGRAEVRQLVTIKLKGA